VYLITAALEVSQASRARGDLYCCYSDLFYLVLPDLLAEFISQPVVDMLF
jgi:hypothetical protein